MSKHIIRCMEDIKQISKQTKKILIDITGEPQLGVAINMTLKDAARYRLNEINKRIKRFYDKYKTDFGKFEKLWKEGKIKNKFSYDVEKDYLEWDSLVTRKDKLERILKWIV